MDSEGPLSETTAGRGEFILESRMKSRSPGRTRNHSGFYLVKTKIISLERQDRHVLKKLSCLGDDTALDR